MNNGGQLRLNGLNLLWRSDESDGGHAAAAQNPGVVINNLVLFGFGQNGPFQMVGYFVVVWLFCPANNMEWGLILMGFVGFFGGFGDGFQQLFFVNLGGLCVFNVAHGAVFKNYKPLFAFAI